MEEIWKPVVGYEGLYEVSNLGRVRSLNYRNTGKVKELISHDNGFGYLIVELRNSGNRKTYSVHRLVAQAFIPNPDNLPEVNHRDLCKTNNCLLNLEWCSRKYNLEYSDICGRGRYPVLQFTKSGEFVKEYESLSDASRQTGIFKQNIRRCCLNKLLWKSAGGFIWRYK